MTVTKTPLYRKTDNGYVRVYCEKPNWKLCREHKNDLFILPQATPMIEFSEPDTDTVLLSEYEQDVRVGTGIGGLEYENHVLSIINSMQDSTSLKIVNDSSAGFSAHGADLELELNGQPFNVEVKKDLGAQMGGGIIDYDLQSDTLTPKGNLIHTDALILEQIMSLAEARKPAIISYINFIQSIDPNFATYNKQAGIPIKAHVKHRDQAKRQGLLKAINGIISTDTTFMEQHYNAKNVYYIQIGKAGLFYMGENPNSLPVPRLQGIINVEFRLGYSGTKHGTEGDYRAASLRAQARIKSKLSSPYSLDDVKSIRKLASK